MPLQEYGQTNEELMERVIPLYSIKISNGKLTLHPKKIESHQNHREAVLWICLLRILGMNGYHMALVDI